MGTGGPSAPWPGPIEVEAKFAVGPGTEAALAALGAVGLPHTPPFRDCYFDGPGAPLGRADVWLRHRQGQGWQLKLPHAAPRPPHGAAQTRPAATSPPPPHGVPPAPHGDPRPPGVSPPGAATAYREVWGDAEVLAELLPLLGAASAPWGSVGAALGPLGLRPTASFVTRRRSARLGEGLRVELDEADFGYRLGEVEMEVPDPREVAAARRRVEGVCRALGAEPQRHVPGKLTVFLARHRPRYYRLLRAAGRLEGPGEGGGERDPPWDPQ